VLFNTPPSVLLKIPPVAVVVKGRVGGLRNLRTDPSLQQLPTT
jgi:hypothetical protein